jgi:uncharacterized protein (TIGR02099 family)
MTHKPGRKRASPSGLKRLMDGAVRLRSVIRRLRQRLPKSVKRALRRTTRWSLHGVLGVLISLVIIFVAARLWLPTVVEHKYEIEAYLSSTAGNPVRLGTLEAYWDGLNPGVRVQGFRIDYASTGRPALFLKEVRLTLSWRPLLTGRIEIGSLTLVEPSLTVERRPDGSMRVTGLESQSVPEQPEESVIDWLLQQREMVIENGELLWLDRLSAAGDRTGAAEERLKVTRVNITLRNDGNRHRLDFQADFPRRLCAACRLSADVTGQPFRGNDWNGELAVLARGLSVEALPRILASRLPAGVAGRVDVRLTSRWRNGRPAEIDGYAGVSELRVPLRGEQQPLAVSTADATFNWTGKPDDWQLDLNRLRLGLTGPAWLAGHARVEQRAGRSRVRIDHVDVGDTGKFAARLPHTGAVFDWLRGASPAGGLDGVRVEFSRAADGVVQYLAEADLRNIRFAAVERIPGVRGLGGHLRFAPDGGEFRLSSNAGRVHMPRVFREPLEFTRMASRIRWQQGPDDWSVKAEDIALAASDVEAVGVVGLRLPKDRSLSPVLKVRADFSNGNAAHAARYFPLIMPEGLRNYLGHALVAGRATDGSVSFQGALRDFPFRDGKKGQFEVRAHVKDGVFEYLPGWTPVTNLDTDLYFTSKSMLITANQGRLRALRVGRVVVAIDDFLAPGGPVVQVSARAAGPLQEGLAVLAESKSERFVPYLVPGLRAEGNGILTLDLHIPAVAPNALRIGGNYQFVNNAIEFPLRGMRLEALRGNVEFNESGLRAGRWNARFLGGDTAFLAAPEAEGARVEASGTLTQAGMAMLVGPGFATKFSGAAPWKALLDWQPKGSALSVEADLRDLELSLPAPFAKARGEPLAIVAHTESNGRDGHVLDLQAGGRLSGKLAFEHGAGGWGLTRGQIGIGERVTTLPPRRGLTLSVRLPSLGIDPWLQLLHPSLSDGGAGGWPTSISHVSAEVDALEVFGRPLGHLVLDLDKKSYSWQGRLEGEAIAGQAVLIPPCGGRRECMAAVGNQSVDPGLVDRLAIHLALTKLALPPARSDAAEADIDPRSLPMLSIRSDSFQASGHNLGALDFRAVPVRQGWKISDLRLTRPDATLAATGAWEVDRDGAAATRIDATLASSNLGAILDEFGYAGEMVGGKLKLASNLAWPGAPGDFEPAQLTGEMSVSLADGRLPEISPGAGRLLGVLDLRSLTRYLTLDFSNLFGKGLVFDSIRGKVGIERGDAHMQDFMIRSPGAEIGLSGRLGYVRRDVDMEMVVTPHLMEELAITGGLIGGPAVGAAVALLHNLVKKPFEKGTRINYTVKGTWDNPVVTRLGEPLVLPPAE